MAKIDITKTELVWPGKYHDDGTLKEVPRVTLPFQIIETVNESRATREAKKGGVQGTLLEVYEGSRLENGVVRTPDGWAEAYRAFVAAGWNAVPFDHEFGGQGLPWLVAMALQEMWHSSAMAFALCPMLTQAAIEAIHHHGSAALKARFSIA